ncbi:MAG: cytochrome c maturation protein CcmE [Candidatus Bipolaricaulia bacterium]
MVAKTRKKRYQMAVGVTVIVIGIGYLLISSFSGTTVYYYQVDELSDLEILPTERIRVSGQLVPGTVNYDPTIPMLRFTLASEGSSAQLQVIYREIQPDNFLRSTEVVVTGYLEGDRFTAEEMLVKCPSRYESVPEEGS